MNIGIFEFQTNVSNLIPILLLDTVSHVRNATQGSSRKTPCNNISFVRIFVRFIGGLSFSFLCCRRRRHAAMAKEVISCFEGPSRLRRRIRRITVTPPSTPVSPAYVFIAWPRFVLQSPAPNNALLPPTARPGITNCQRREWENSKVCPCRRPQPHDS